MVEKDKKCSRKDILSKTPSESREIRGTGIKEYQDEITKTTAVPAHEGLDLDKTLPHPYVAPNDDFSFKWVEEMVQLAKDDFFIDGAHFVFSTGGQILIEGEEKIEKFRAEQAVHVFNSLPSRAQYLVRIKYVGATNKGEPFIKDKIDPLLVKKGHKNRIVSFSNTTRPGALMGIDKLYYENGYADNALVYGLYLIRDPDLRNLLPLKEGDLNCVAQRVLEHFQDATRGQKLTPAKQNKILKWEKKVTKYGARIEDVSVLETIIKRPIILKDITGEDLYNSGKFQRSGWRKIELIAHNGHAFSNDLKFPRVRTVHIYEGDIWNEIQRVLQGQPIAVWLLNGLDDGFSQFVLQDGRVFKTRAAHDKIKNICEEFGDEELANRVFSLNHAVSVIAREKN